MPNVEQLYVCVIWFSLKGSYCPALTVRNPRVQLREEYQLSSSKLSKYSFFPTKKIQRKFERPKIFCINKSCPQCELNPKPLLLGPTSTPIAPTRQKGKSWLSSKSVGSGGEKFVFHLVEKLTS